MLLPALTAGQSVRHVSQRYGLRFGFSKAKEKSIFQGISWVLIILAGKLISHLPLIAEQPKASRCVALGADPGGNKVGSLR